MRVDETIASFASMRLEAFHTARQHAQATLSCLNEPLTPVDAAAYHRAIALSSYVSQDDAGTVAAFRAARRIQPGYSLPSTIAPPGNQLYVLFEEASPGTVSSDPVTIHPHPGEVVLVDGSRSAIRPTDSPVILQRMDASGAIMDSVYLVRDATPPSWTTAPLVSESLAMATPKARNVRPALLWTGFGLGVFSGGMYAIAAKRRATYDDPGTPYNELAELKAQTNALVMASGATAILAVGIGTASLLHVSR